MDRNLRDLFLFLLGCTLLFRPAPLLADSKASFADSKHRPLRTFVQGPTEGLKPGMAKSEWQRLRLLTLSRRLDRDLTNLQSASQWQSFLRMPYEVTILKNTGRADRKPHSLNTSLERFTLVAEQDRYQRIASLPSFQAVHLALQTYAASHSQIEMQAVKSSAARRSDEKTQQWIDQETQRDSTSVVDRLPPVLISAEQPDLLTPPAPSATRKRQTY